MNIIFDNKQIQIKLDNTNHCIEFHWKANSSLEYFKEMMSKICYYAHMHNCNKLIPDLENLSSAPDKFKDWARAEWFPNLVKNGVTTFLIINPYSESIINSIYESEEFILKLKNNTSIRTFYFKDIESARDWLIINRL